MPLRRNEKLAIQVLAESTLAAQEGCIHYLAAAAGLQQWGQAALAFLALWKSEQGLSAAQLGEAVETTLEDSFRVSPCLSSWQREGYCVKLGNSALLALLTPWLPLWHGRGVRGCREHSGRQLKGQGHACDAALAGQ